MIDWNIQMLLTKLSNKICFAATKEAVVFAYTWGYF